MKVVRVLVYDGNETAIREALKQRKVVHTVPQIAAGYQIREIYLRAQHAGGRATDLLSSPEFTLPKFGE